MTDNDAYITPLVAVKRGLEAFEPVKGRSQMKSATLHGVRHDRLEVHLDPALRVVEERAMHERGAVEGAAITGRRPWSRVVGGVPAAVAVR